jgi:hypothetical protein
MNGDGATPPRHRATGGTMRSRVDSTDNMRTIDAQVNACRCVRIWPLAAACRDSRGRETGELRVALRCERVGPRVCSERPAAHLRVHVEGRFEYALGCSTSYGA